MKIFLDKARFRVYIVYMQYRQYEQLKQYGFTKENTMRNRSGFARLAVIMIVLLVLVLILLF
jgi:hypothetical protein